MKKENKQKILIKRVVTKSLYELIVAILLGMFPVIIYTTNSETLEKTIGALLAPGEIISYSGYLICLYAGATGFRWGMRFASENLQEKLELFHKVTAEIGTSFLTILRVGLGAIIGIVVVASTTKIIVITQSQYISLLGYILMTLIALTALSALHDFLAKATKKPSYDNPLRFDSRLKD